MNQTSIVRQGMFETNSSSTHCLVCNGSSELSADLLDTLTLDPTVWTVESYLDSGAETAKDKLAFFAGLIKQYSPYYGPGLTQIERQVCWQNLCEVVREQTGYSLYYPEENRFEENDQGSLSQTFFTICKDKDRLRQAIFNPNFKIVVNCN